MSSEAGDKNEDFDGDNEALAERRENGYIALFLVVLAFSLIVGHLVSHKWECKYIGEAGVILLIGTVFSFFITLNDERESTNASAKKPSFEECLRRFSLSFFFLLLSLILDMESIGRCSFTTSGISLILQLSGPLFLPSLLGLVYFVWGK